MADFRSIAEAQARRYFRRPRNRRRFVTQMGAEANFEDVNSAYAEGPAQFTPDTARSVGLKNPHDPVEAYGAAAKLMKSYLTAYHGDWEKALTAYNAGPGAVGKPLPGETSAYIKRILGAGGAGGGADRQNGAGRGAGAGGGTIQDVKLGTKTSFDQAGFDQAKRRTLLAGFLSKHSNPDSVLFKSGLLSTAAPDPADFTSSKLTSKIVGHETPLADVVAGGRRGKVVVAAGANRAGVGIQPIVKRFVADVAGAYGKPITIGTGTNHNRLTVDGNVSDHWDGHASDLPVPVDSAEGDAIAAHALELAGVEPKRAAAMARKGGLYTLTPKSGPFAGRRIQVIWKTYAGGNHHNHVHVGIR